MAHGNDIHSPAEKQDDCLVYVKRVVKRDQK